MLFKTLKVFEHQDHHWSFKLIKLLVFFFFIAVLKHMSTVPFDWIVARRCNEIETGFLISLSVSMHVSLQMGWNSVQRCFMARDNRKP